MSRSVRFCGSSHVRAGTTLRLEHGGGCLMASLTRPSEATSTATTQTVLTDEMLARFSKRAPQYDRDNVFFADDFDELKQAGYLRLAVPKELGGAGLSLAGVAHQQRRLGYYAAPTALAINMHLYWTGTGAVLLDGGDTWHRGAHGT